MNDEPGPALEGEPLERKRLGLAPHQFSEIAQRTGDKASSSSSSFGDGDVQRDSFATSTMEARIEQEMLTKFFVR